MPAQSMQHPLSALSLSGPTSNDTDDRNHVQSQPMSQQPVFLPMATHGAGPMMGAPAHIQHLGFQTGPPPPVGPPSMSLPRGLIPGLQHSSHLGGVSGMPPENILEQQVRRYMFNCLELSRIRAKCVVDSFLS